MDSIRIYPSIWVQWVHPTKQPDPSYLFEIKGKGPVGPVGPAFLSYARTGFFLNTPYFFFFISRLIVDCLDPLDPWTHPFKFGVSFGSMHFLHLDPWTQLIINSRPLSWLYSTYSIDLIIYFKKYAINKNLIIEKEGEGCRKEKRCISAFKKILSIFKKQFFRGDHCFKQAGL